VDPDPDPVEGVEPRAGAVVFPTGDGPAEIEDDVVEGGRERIGTRKLDVAGIGAGADETRGVNKRGARRRNVLKGDMMMGVLMVRG